MAPDDTDLARHRPSEARTHGGRARGGRLAVGVAGFVPGQWWRHRPTGNVSVAPNQCGRLWCKLPASLRSSGGRRGARGADVPPDEKQEVN